MEYYYVEKPKQVFNYTTADGKEHFDITDEYINSLSLTDEVKDSLYLSIKRFNNHLVYFEKKWANEMLRQTDFMMVIDSTYNRQKIHQCFMLDDIINYRDNLRNYKINPIELDRPKKPEWMK